uniref:Putative secreted protein n=1 Tax=Anopheles darlingi TaxID=43151 RepID=A0A2M4D1Q8_ANODA
MLSIRWPLGTPVPVPLVACVSAACARRRDSPKRTSERFRKHRTVHEDRKPCPAWDTRTIRRCANSNWPSSLARGRWKFPTDVVIVLVAYC